MRKVLGPSCYNLFIPINESLTIEPEIIPDNSNEGESAQVIYTSWLPLIILIFGFIMLYFFLKVVFTFLLMTIGIVFIWNRVRFLLSK